MRNCPAGDERVAEYRSELQDRGQRVPAKYRIWKR
jgi:hypothetical protein